MRVKKQLQPPAVALKFFRWYCRPEMRSHIEGDLQELYQERAAHHRRKADLFFFLDVLMLCRPGIVRSHSFNTRTNTFGMYKSYFKIGWRNLLRNKGYSIINIGGLALGVSVAIIIGLWVTDELTFNHVHTNHNRIAQIMKGGTVDGVYMRGQTFLQYPMISELRDNYGDNFKYIVPAQGKGSVLSNGDKKFEQSGQYMGEDAPSMFSWQMLAGNAGGLHDVSSIMLSKSTAIALFGNIDLVGQSVRFDATKDATITGVYEDFPKNSFLYGVQFVMPFAANERDNTWILSQGWENHFLQLYVQIADGMTMEQVASNVIFAERKAIENLAYMKGSLKYNFESLMLPMNDWHLRAKFNDGQLQTGPQQLVWFIGAIGTFVLLLACINFMNLSTARSEKRAKEVGIRKSIGSVRTELIRQFFTESFLVVILAFVVALIIDLVAMPSFNEISGKSITMPLLEPMFWGSAIIFIMVTGLIAGSYPALYLSSFNAVAILRRTYKVGKSAATPRRILVVAQFTVSVMLIAGTGVIYDQLMYVKNRPVGYEREGLLMINRNHTFFDQKEELLKSALNATGMVSSISKSGGDITTIWSGNGGFTWEGKDPALDASFNTLNVGPEFGKTVGWKFVDGRDFSNEIKSDTAGFILNQAAVKYMNLKDPVGKIVHWSNSAWGIDSDFRVIAVIEDMLMDSPFEDVSPTIYFTKGWMSFLVVRVAPGKTMTEAIPAIEKVFNTIIPDVPFSSRFADVQFAAKFSAEERVGKLAGIFASLAILISCLGLFGLAAYIAEQRTKEIGIRKILGASVPGLWRLLSREFIILVGISCLIAIPVAYYFLKAAIEKYEYHGAIGLHIFVLAAVGAIVITIATVSLQAIKAALSNPVKSLRSE